MEKKIIYFEKPGADNTFPVFNEAEKRLIETGAKKLILASTTGKTAEKALEYFRGKDVKLIIVPHQYDFTHKENLFPKELVKKIRSEGHEVYFGSMLFHTDKLFGSTVQTIAANFLRCFSEGVKVCVEIVLMATDGGMISSGEKVVAAAGTSKGTDTALLIQAASSQNLKHLRILEIICKPYNSI
jgi:uncharacterized protein